MCGIAGFVGEGNRDHLVRMTNRVSHRGPDGEGFWTGDQVFFGHRRLSIVDLAGGTQPMRTADEALVITYNGEIYNHVELRKELEKAGHQFQTDHSDTEVLLHGYREWGPAILDRLNGMWAFAIFDRTKNELFLSRDRFGKKPLFYYSDERCFAFASELSALREHPRVPASLDPVALQKLFAYGFIPAPLTMLARVRKLPAGYWLRVPVSTLIPKTSKYWEFQFDPFPTVPKDAEEQWGAELIRRLDEAVRIRLNADVPVGAFLSGGIDSTLVAKLASNHQKGIRSFSIGFTEKSFDEREYARLAATSIGTTHREEVLSIERCLELCATTAQQLDEVMGDSSILPTGLVARLAREEVKVVVTGDAGDELFAGYDPFRALRFAAPYQQLVPAVLHRTALKAVERIPVSHVNMSLDFRVKRTLRGLSYQRSHWMPAWMGPLDSAEIGQLFGQKIDPEDLYSEAADAWNEPTAQNDVERTMQFYIRLYLADDILVKVDRSSMAHGLEARCPFLDINVVDFVRRIPSSFKLRGGVTKYLLKKAVRGLVPDTIIDRPKKGFGVPIGRWFQSGDLRFATNSSPSLLNWEWINGRLAEHQAGKRDDRAMLWCAWLLAHGAPARPVGEEPIANSR
jgi:asparagine synthase (glutamine-hydrolysing)